MSSEAPPAAYPSRGRHIVDTMCDAPPPEATLPGAPRPSHAVPVPRPVDQASLLIPTSAFSTYVPFRPRCGHITMTRIYHVGFRCERCNRHGQFGWLYRCTEQRELILDDMKRHGFKVAFDEIGAQFAEQMSLGKWGPDKRQDKYSVLHEMAQEQMQSYTPDQIAVLLAQRENVWKTAEEEMRSPQHNGGRARSSTSFEPNPLVLGSRGRCETVHGEELTESPWVPTMQQECQFKACHNCYRRAAEKTWLSLDGIVNGDIPPTVAGAYSFHYMQQRPICDASVVSKIGYRAVPLPRRPRPIIDLTHSDDEPAMRIIQYNNNEYNPDDDSDWTTTDDDSSAYSDSAFDEEPEELPLALPLSRTSLRRCAPHGTLRAYLEPSGRVIVRPQEAMAVKAEHVQYPCAVAIMASPPVEFYETAVFQQMGAIIEAASKVPLPGPTFEEELFFTEEIMAGFEAADQEQCHRFGSGPPYVPGGIAVREEAEEARMADIVTQV